jgi:hypothetical protein
MKNTIPRLLAVSTLGLLACATHLSAQTSTFTYQGALTQNGQPANGTYDFMFRLLDAETDGTAAPVIPLNPGVGVTNGLFTTGIDFDAENLNGANLWLEISVRTNGGGAFTTLAPRQLLTSAPYAVRAANVSASGISGTYGNTVTFNNAANSFAGSGAALTALNATELTQGTVPPAALNNAWKIGGNAGTAASTHFIGTIDDQPLEVKVNGVKALTITPSPGAANIVAGSAENFAAEADGATISGGFHNSSRGVYTTIGGGINNQVNEDAATVGGGKNNVASGGNSVIGGGLNNDATGQHSSIAGGEGGLAAGRSAAIGGGAFNIANGDYSIIPGGSGNFAASYSFAAGSGAKAINVGTFVWADASGSGFLSSADNQVNFRASGGYRLFTDSSESAGVSLAPDATAWSVISDRAVKKDFAAVDSREVLEKLAAVPVQSWHYQWESANATPHLGPVAQDFKAAFYPGRDDQSITTLEFDGVALAAIQGLNQKLEARSQESEARSQLIERKLEEELRRRDAENTELRRQNGELLRRLEAIEARLR